MTNEEKAKILEKKYETPCHGVGDCEFEAHLAALEMADWKNEQIDTILHTVEGCLRSFFEVQGNTQESIDNFIDAIKAQINKNLNEWKNSSKD